MCIKNKQNYKNLRLAMLHYLYAIHMLNIYEIYGSFMPLFVYQFLAIFVLKDFYLLIQKFVCTSYRNLIIVI